MKQVARNRAAFALVVIAFLSVSSQAQGSHTVEGKVVLPSGSPPRNPVKVTLTFNGRRIHETFTDLSGRFSITGLRAGTYQLTAEGDGSTFENTSVAVDIAAFGNSPQTFTQNIQLITRQSAPVAPAGVVSAEEKDPSIPERARKAYQKAIKRAEDKKPEEAAKLFEEALEAHPGFYSAHIGLGEQLAALQRYDEAAAVYQKAIELKADRADGHTGLGVVLVKQKKYAEAIAPLRRSKELDKKSSTSYLFLGLAEMFTGDYQSAETDLLRSYEIAKQPVIHVYLANVYEQRGEPAKAIERLQAFLKENPDHPGSRQIREAIEKLRKQVADKN